MLRSLSVILTPDKKNITVCLFFLNYNNHSLWQKEHNLIDAHFFSLRTEGCNVKIAKIILEISCSSH